jgi:hypothetical protein
MTQHISSSTPCSNGAPRSWDEVPFHMQPGEVVEVPLLLSAGKCRPWKKRRIAAA